MKLLAAIIALAGGVVLSIWGVNAFLAVDDLAACPAPDPLSDSCTPADAIIAVSGGDTFARAQEAINLYSAGWAPTLLFSGAALDTSGPSNAEAMRRQARSAGVPEDALLLDHNSYNTTANATYAKQLLPGAERIIVVTSPYHQRRVSLEFAHAFGPQVTVLSHPTSTDRTWGPYWWLAPIGWWLALSEVFKTLYVMVTL